MCVPSRVHSVKCWRLILKWSFNRMKTFFPRSFHVLANIFFQINVPLPVFPKVSPCNGTHFAGTSFNVCRYLFVLALTHKWNENLWILSLIWATGQTEEAIIKKKPSKLTSQLPTHVFNSCWKRAHAFHDATRSLDKRSFFYGGGGGESEWVTLK